MIRPQFGETRFRQLYDSGKHVGRAGVDVIEHDEADRVEAALVIAVGRAPRQRA